MTCEGQIETWLTSFLQGLKAALQFQLATAMGTEKMPVKTRQIRSAGSRKVTLPARASSSTEKANKKGTCIYFFLYNTLKILKIGIPKRITSA